MLDNYQEIVIVLVIYCSSTCFGRLYAHHQEVRLRFHRRPKHVEEQLITNKITNCCI